MATTLTWVETNGTSGSHSSNDVSNINFGNTDAYDLTPADYPIKQGDNSYDKYVYLNFSGSFTKVSNIFVYKSAGDYVADETISLNGSVAYVTPQKATDRLSGDGAIPTSKPAAANVGIGQDTSGSISGPSATGRTDYIRLQTQIGASSPAGGGNQKTFTVVYDIQ